MVPEQASDTWRAQRGYVPLQIPRKIGKVYISCVSEVDSAQIYLDRSLRSCVLVVEVEPQVQDFIFRYITQLDIRHSDGRGVMRAVIEQYTQSNKQRGRETSYNEVLRLIDVIR